MQEYRLEIKVKNNLIVKKIEQAGYKTVREFCRLNNLMSSLSLLGNIINMKHSPFRSTGDWCTIILKCSEILGCAPEDFFTDVQLNTILKTNKRHIEVHEAEMKFMLENNQQKQKLLEEIVEEDQQKKSIENMLQFLTPRESKVLQMRFGLGEYCNTHTLEECGIEMNITRQRVRYIEAKALRKLRHPERNSLLSEYQNGI